jgi:aminoglycoside phosphotransferase (APT) family kinase protein
MILFQKFAYDDTMEFIGRGRTAEIYRTNDGKALKLYCEGVSERVIAHEARISNAVGSSCDVAPEFFGEASSDGRAGLLFQLIEGTPLIDKLKYPQFDPIELARQMADIHRSVHATSADGFPEMQDALGRGSVDCDRLNSEGVRKLATFLDKERGNQVCHGDLHVENVIEDKDGRLWVIDWTNAYRGNPISDISRSLYLILHGLPENQNHINPEERGMREKVADDFIRFYGGEDPRQEKDWDIWRLLILLNRITENIDRERSEIDRMISEILESRAEFV